MQNTSTAAKNPLDFSQGNYVHAPALDTRKRIGSTVYVKRVFVKNGEGESMQDKIIRLAKNELNFAPKTDKVIMLQTERLSERSSL